MRLFTIHYLSVLLVEMDLNVGLDLPFYNI
jgi:hypothetical protein